MGLLKRWRKLKKKTKALLIGVVLILILVAFYTCRYFYLFQNSVFDESDPLWVRIAVTSGLADLSKEWIEY